MNRRSRALLRLCFAAIAALALGAVGLPAHAQEPGPTGFYETGSSRRTGPNGADYVIVHEMQQLPRGKTPDAVRDANTTKRFVLTFLRDMPCEQFRSNLDGGFVRNGLTSAADRGRLATLKSACTKPVLKAHSQVILLYRADTSTTTVWIEKMGTVSIVGVDAMRSLWSLWLGRPDQEATRNALVRRL